MCTYINQPLSFLHNLVSAVTNPHNNFQGVEPASLALGRVGDVTLVMVGSERPGTVAVYSIDHRNPQLTPVFHTFIVDIRDTSGTWQSLYDNRQASIIDPEDILYVWCSHFPYFLFLFLLEIHITVS